MDSLSPIFEGKTSKEGILSALAAHAHLLDRISLQLPNVTVEQAQKDFRRERVLLNDVPFIPDQVDVNRNNGFSMCLTKLVERLQQRLPSATFLPQNLSNIIMQRSCRTSAGADSFFVVQKYLCAEGTFVSQKTSSSNPPIKIDVFISDAAVDAENGRPVSSSTTCIDSRPNSVSSVSSRGCEEVAFCVSSASNCSLCARVEIRNYFSIFDNSATDFITGADTDPPPWLDVEAIVVDESNFDTGQSRRTLQLRIGGFSSKRGGDHQTSSTFRLLMSPLRNKKMQLKSPQ